LLWPGTHSVGQEASPVVCRIKAIAGAPGADLPCILRATTDFAYVRMHGPDHHHLYAGSYSDADLMWWTDRIHEWNATGKDVFVYFNNDGNANAVRNARTLRTLLDP
jgi:uncharacterized protein YecE (DUF72 family)